MGSFDGIRFASKAAKIWGGGQLPACLRSYSDGPERYASRALLVGAKTEPRTFSVKSYLSR